jgi:hypothetical protein
VDEVVLRGFTDAKRADLGERVIEVRADCWVVVERSFERADLSSDGGADRIDVDTGGAAWDEEVLVKFLRRPKDQCKRDGRLAEAVFGEYRQQRRKKSLVQIARVGDVIVPAVGHDDKVLSRRQQRQQRIVGRAVGRISRRVEVQLDGTKIGIRHGFASLQTVEMTRIGSIKPAP